MRSRAEVLVKVAQLATQFERCTDESEQFGLAVQLALLHALLMPGDPDPAGRARAVRVYSDFIAQQQK